MWTRERRRKEETERTLRLWERISSRMTEAEIYARAGETEESRRRLREALEVCREHLRQTPSAYGQYFLGCLLAELGEREDARRALERALELDPALGEARFERGLLLVEEYAARLETYSQSEFLEPRPENVEELERQHPDLAELRRAAVGDLSVEVGKSSYFKEADGLYGKAELARLRGDVATARDGLERVLLKEPLHSKARLALARLDLIQGRIDSAFGHVNRAVDGHKGFSAAYVLRASMFVRAARGNRARSEECLKRSLADAESAQRAGAEEDQIHTLRGLVASARQEWDKAILEWSEVVRLRPRLAVAWCGRGLARFQKRERVAAISDFSQAIALNDRYAEAYLNRGLARSEERDLEGAVADYEAALRIRPRFAEAYHNRGILRYREGKWEEALADFSRAIEYRPRFAEAYRSRAAVWIRKNDFDAAIRDCDVAIDLNGRMAEAYFNRGVARSRKGILDGAIEDYTQTLSINDRHPDAYRFRAHAWRKKGKTAEAIADLEKALEVAPPDWRYREQAREELEKFRRTGS